jgi:hypothetical protein
MPSNGPSGSGATIPPGADDFTRIRGINPKIANRLFEVGILTFAKLATMTPNEIVARIGAVSGVSAESIAKKDWVGQARELASQMEPADETPAADSQHRADFAVKLQLNADNTVGQTHVMHMQSGGEEIWDGWIAERLNNFFVQRANLSLAALEVKAAAIVEAAPQAAAAEKPPKAAAEPAVTVGLKGQARLQELIAIPARSSQPSRALSSGQPFDLRLLLDLSEVKAPKDMPLNYTATIYAKGLDTHRNQTVGEMRGTASPAEQITLKLEGAELPQGVYRLQAAVTLTLPTKTNGPVILPQFLDGGVLQVR